MKNNEQKNLAARLSSEEAEVWVTPSVHLEGGDAHMWNAILSFHEKLADSIMDRMPDKEELHLSVMMKQGVHAFFCK